MAAEDERYSDDFGSEEDPSGRHSSKRYSEDFGSEDDPSGRHSSKSSSMIHRSRRSSEGPLVERSDDSEEEHYSDTFEAEQTVDATMDSGLAGRNSSGIAALPTVPPSAPATVSRRGSPPLSQSESTDGENPSLPVVRVLDMSQQPQQLQDRDHKQADPHPAAEAKSASVVPAAGLLQQHFQNEVGGDVSRGQHVRIEGPPKIVKDLPVDSGKHSPKQNNEHSQPSVLCPPEVARLPSVHWRAPDSLPHAVTPANVDGCTSRNQDAIPRHLKPHAWDLASLGQEQPTTLEHCLNTADHLAGIGQLPENIAHHRKNEARVQTSAGYHGQSIGSHSRTLYGDRTSLPAGTAETIAEELAQRFILGRRDAGLRRQERAAYQNMLQQVAWTALEPAHCQEVALLLGKGRAPVSSLEALRAFRRCLHSVLTDDRVLDIVEHQMALHFRRAAGVTGSSHQMRDG